MRFPGARADELTKKADRELEKAKLDRILTRPRAGAAPSSTEQTLGIG